MRKFYRLTIDISVDVNEKVKVFKRKDNPRLIGFIQQLLKAFLKYPTQILEFYKFQFPDLMVHGNCYDVLLDILEAKDMPEIVADQTIKNELTLDAAEFIETIHATTDTYIKDDDCVYYRNLFTNQFTEPKIIHAEFQEIENENLQYLK